MEFKECFECKPKPGSPQLCAQCLWVRENYKSIETLEQRVRFNAQDMGELGQFIKVEYAINIIKEGLAAQREEIRKEILSLVVTEQEPLVSVVDIYKLPSLTK